MRKNNSFRGSWRRYWKDPYYLHLLENWRFFKIILKRNQITNVYYSKKLPTVKISIKFPNWSGFFSSISHSLLRKTLLSQTIYYDKNLTLTLFLNDFLYFIRVMLKCPKLFHVIVMSHSCHYKEVAIFPNYSSKKLILSSLQNFWAEELNCWGVLEKTRD